MEQPCSTTKLHLGSLLIVFFIFDLNVVGLLFLYIPTQFFSRSVVSSPIFFIFLRDFFISNFILGLFAFSKRYPPSFVRIDKNKERSSTNIGIDRIMGYVPLHCTQVRRPSMISFFFSNVSNSNDCPHLTQQMYCRLDSYNRYQH